MSFLGKLADQITSQFVIGENQDHNLDKMVDGQNIKYGKLGDFANKFDQTSQRKYLEEGYLRKDPYFVDSKQFEILMQQPSATVLVKKRMFTSLADNYNPAYMDIDERLFFKCSKVLLQNKCNQISALEKLSKIEKITSAANAIDEQITPLIISLADEAGLGFYNISDGVFGTSGSSEDASKFSQIVDKLRKVYAYSKPAFYTTWIKDNTNLYRSTFGEGTGVLELTNFTGLETKTTTDMRTEVGNFSIRISDPYDAMSITEYDIEKAISDATNLSNNHKIFQLGLTSIEDVINNARTRLNQLRSDRGVSPISIKINHDTLFGQRVTAIFDRLGVELPFQYDGGFSINLLKLDFSKLTDSGVTVEDQYLINGALVGVEGLNTQKKIKPKEFITFGNATNDSELSAFQKMVNAIFTKLQLLANSKNILVTNNQKTNYVRRKMRSTFLGQSIIQPMDTVHIWIASKSKYDNRILSGLKSNFSGLSVLQKFSSAATDLKNQFNTVFNPGANLDLQAEKSIFVGPNFPSYVWAMIRPQFVSEKEGAHVFAGLVNEVSPNFTPGNNSVSISGSDNSHYFDLGQINFKPGVDTFNGSIYDPLTPFKSKFDKISTNYKNENLELLDENKILLGTLKDSGKLVKRKGGANAGEFVNQESYIQDAYIDKRTGYTKKVYYAPDGLVYRWKEGIGVFVQFGDALDLNKPIDVGNPALYKDPFAGQDVMNVISLLITGQPYNFITYWKNVTQLEGFSGDSNSNKNAAYSYFESLRTQLVKNNTLWGSFIPFKNLVLDEQSKKLLDTQFRLNTNITKLNETLQQIANLKNNLATYATVAENINFQNQDSKVQEIKAKIATLTASAKVMQDEIRGQDSYNDTISIVGNGVTFDTDGFLNNESGKNSTLSSPEIRKTLRRKVNYLTRRLSWAVRANEDKNLFIVDDTYDNDYDILAYEKVLNDKAMSLYNEPFHTVKDNIVSTALLLNLEVYCDTQGHIRIRPPQYNRIPSSVFYRMMQLKKSQGIQFYPEFLNDLLTNQISGLKERIEIIEDQIRLDCVLLGELGDINCQSFINSDPNPVGGSISFSTGAPFTFISDVQGNITDLTLLLSQATPDALENNPGSNFAIIQGQATSTKSQFNPAARFDKTIALLDQPAALKYSGPGTDLNNQMVTDIITRIELKSGQKVNLDNYLAKVPDNTITISIPSNKYVDPIVLTNDISTQLELRQKLVKQLYGAIKNSVESKSLDDGSDTGNLLIAPGTKNKDVPELYEHMIEDESYDDYGPDSGKRYIIKNSQIKELSIKVNQPEYSAVEVHGTLSDYFAVNQNLPGGLNSFPQGGNGLVSAIAVDYDTWRSYGLKQPTAIKLPFLNDPQKQLAPYASMLLSIARKNILRGTVTIVGNEYMQPGDVVYIEQKGLLFYVQSVSHSINMGRNFSTRLSLTYGHTPGEYIPNVLDVIGKVIYKNKDEGNLVNYRQSTSYNEKNVGVLIFDKDNSGVIKLLDNSYNNRFSVANSNTIKNLIYQSYYIINGNVSKASNVDVNVELRIYYDSTLSSSGTASNNLISFANMARDIITGVVQTNSQSDSGKLDLVLSPDRVKEVNMTLIDLSNKDDYRSPSKEAWNASREHSANNSSSDGISGAPSDDPSNSNDSTPNSEESSEDTGLSKVVIKKERDKLRNALFGYIVDCWIKLDNVDPAKTG